MAATHSLVSSGRGTLFLLACFLFHLSGEVRGQDKLAAGFDQLIAIDSTDMVVASVQERGKSILSLREVKTLLFLNTRTRETRQLQLPAGFVIGRTFLNVAGRYEGERLVVISGTHKGWGNPEKTEWEDPSYLFISTASGQHLKQVSPAAEVLVEWVVNRHSNTLTFITRPDTNQDRKFDAKDSTKLYVYQLTTGQLAEVSAL
ncbi:hypothetical protein ACFSC6_22325 [Rufibacter sediminis]|uniref:Uncharacterized protein n=1 Tax=Rufibacter sediminis TaxID=2762756 RepID=A0ABR6VVN2_9BACT|nr:hypothetical protein [Rufibacter sediminis]MBC3540878.1 hypothetical protein [Rufibacter sediminis]